MIRLRIAAIGLSILAVVAAVPVGGQQAPPAQAPEQVLTVTVTPATLTLKLGEKATLSATVKAAAGRAVADATVTYTSSSRRQLVVSAEGVVEAAEPGTYTVTVIADDRPH